LFLLFPQKFLKCPIFLLLDFAAYKKKTLVISFGYCPKYINSIRKEKIKKQKEKKRKEKKSFKETFIGFCRRKLNKEKLDQINLKLAQI